MIKKGFVLLTLLFVLGAAFYTGNARALFPAQGDVDEADAAARVLEEQKKEKALIALEAAAEKKMARENDALLVSRIKERMAAQIKPQEIKKPAKDIIILPAIILSVIVALVILARKIIRGRFSKSHFPI